MSTNITDALNISSTKCTPTLSQTTCGLRFMKSTGAITDTTRDVQSEVHVLARQWAKPEFKAVGGLTLTEQQLRQLTGCCSYYAETPLLNGSGRRSYHSANPTLDRCLATREKLDLVDNYIALNKIIEKDELLDSLRDFKQRE